MSEEIKWKSWGVQPSEDGIKRNMNPFYCIHFDQNNIYVLTLLIAQRDKSCFKVPGVYEKLLKMIKEQKNKKTSS